MTGISQSIKGDNNSQLFNNYHNHIGNISSTLGKIMPEIAKIVRDEDEKKADTISYKIDDKISYNNLKTFKEIIEDYGQFGIKIDSLYDRYDNSNPGFKKSALNYFKTKYRLKKQEIHSASPDEDALEVIKKNSDKVIRDIFDSFLEDLKKSNNLKVDMEDLEACVLAVTCHAFIQCKILEKPKNDN